MFDETVKVTFGLIAAGVLCIAIMLGDYPVAVVAGFYALALFSMLYD